MISCLRLVDAADITKAFYDFFVSIAPINNINVCESERLTGDPNRIPEPQLSRKKEPNTKLFLWKCGTSKPNPIIFKEEPNSSK